MNTDDHVKVEDQPVQQEQAKEIARDIRQEQIKKTTAMVNALLGDVDSKKDGVEILH